MGQSQQLIHKPLIQRALPLVAAFTLVFVVLVPAGALAVSPTVMTTGTALAYLEGDGAVAVDAGITVVDTDSPQLAGAEVTISADYSSGEDVLAYVDTPQITGSWEMATGVLTLTGTATVSAYETALASVTFENTGTPPSSTATRTVTFEVTDGVDSASATRDVTVAALPEVTVAVAPADVDENSGTDLVYTFTRTGVTTGDLVVNFTTAGTADSFDFAASASGTVTIVDGDASADVNVTPTGDSDVEPDDTVILTVTSDTAYTVGTPADATGTINNDDTEVTVVVAPADVDENSGTDLVYTFTRTGVTTGDLVVSFTTTGTADGSDFAASASGTVTIADSFSSADVNVTPTGDSDVEPHDTVILTVTSATGYTVGTPGDVTGTINNDDAGIIIVESGGSTDVDEDGATSDTYLVSLSTAPIADVAVTLATDGQVTALSTVGASSTLTFGTGNWATPQEVTVTAVDDAIVEGSHTGTVTNTAASSDLTYDTLVESVIATITDNDAGVIITETGGSTDVAEAGATSDTYDVSLSAAPSDDVIITLAAAGAEVTALSTVGASSTLTFDIGNWATPQEVTVTAIDDASVEGTHSDTITNTASSSDVSYNALVENVLANITDNDSGGGGGGGGGGQPIIGAVVVEGSVDEPGTALDDPIFEGEIVTLDGSFFDPGSFGGHTVRIDWGDGTVEEFTSTGLPGFCDTTGGTCAHTYGDNGELVIAIRVTDNGGLSSTKSVPIAVENAVPSFVSLGIFNAAGQPAIGFGPGDLVRFSGSISDPGTLDTHTVNIDWGDGTITAAAITRTITSEFSGSHVYAEVAPSGEYTASVTVTDDDGGTTTISGPIRSVASHAHTVGLVDTAAATWHLIMPNGAVDTFDYGNPGDQPVVGDWNCDGIETAGLFRPSDAFFYLRNSNTTGSADLDFFAGNGSDVGLAGDFDGDGCAEVGLYRPSLATFYIFLDIPANLGALGAADITFEFGNQGDTPVVGDWDGDGADEVGLYRESTGFMYFRNTLTTGVADGSLFYGDPGDLFVGGDWRGTGSDGPGIFRPADSRYYLKYNLVQGNADVDFPFGQSTWVPVAGIFALG